jgi:hypothetical protein
MRLNNHNFSVYRNFTYTAYIQIQIQVRLIIVIRKNHILILNLPRILNLFILIRD